MLMAQEDAEIDNRFGLVILQMRQMVNDVFTGGGSVFSSSHLSCYSSIFFVLRGANIGAAQ